MRLRPSLGRNRRIRNEGSPSPERLSALCFSLRLGLPYISEKMIVEVPECRSLGAPAKPTTNNPNRAHAVRGLGHFKACGGFSIIIGVKRRHGVRPLDCGTR